MSDALQTLYLVFTGRASGSSHITHTVGGRPVDFGFDEGSGKFVYAFTAHSDGTPQLAEDAELLAFAAKYWPKNEKAGVYAEVMDDKGLAALQSPKALAKVFAAMSVEDIKIWAKENTNDVPRLSRAMASLQMVPESVKKITVLREIIAKTTEQNAAVAAATGSAGEPSKPPTPAAATKPPETDSSAAAADKDEELQHIPPDETGDDPIYVLAQSLLNGADWPALEKQAGRKLNTKTRETIKAKAAEIDAAANDSSDSSSDKSSEGEGEGGF